MNRKRTLTDRTLKALKPASPGTLYDVMDAVVPGLGVRVSETSRRTFILVARFPGSKNPTRRALGEYGALTLEHARSKARNWIELIRKGIDPKVQEGRTRREELRKQQTTFEAVAEDFIERHVKGQRRARDTEREIRKELISRWRTRPISEIARDDVVRLIEEIADRPAPYLAHIVLGHIRSLFNWAINRGTYGLENSPCDRVKPAALIGPKVPRQRVLQDAEIGSLWRASEALGYPFGPLYRLLLLTGARKGELSGARWREFDLGKKAWTVPPERFKSNATHLVPLSEQASAIIEALPRFTKDDHLFSTTFGKKPVSGFSKAKARLDTMMMEDLGSSPAPWVIHDIRRTVRTRLASLRVPDMVAEMVIGHGRKGLQRVYDQHGYEAEMREALEQWARRLRDIVSPAPENVVELRGRA
jgi:integrase